MLTCKASLLHDQISCTASSKVLEICEEEGLPTVIMFDAKWVTESARPFSGNPFLHSTSSPSRKPKNGGQRAGPFENLPRRGEDYDRNKSAKVIVTNVIPLFSLLPEPPSVSLMIVQTVNPEVLQPLRPGLPVECSRCRQSCR